MHPHSSPDHFFPFGFLFNVVWIAGFVLASVLYRRHKGKALPQINRASLRFEERRASGHSLRDLISRFGGARNGLNVAITDKDLLIWVPFPFNLGFIPEVYDLEHCIPLGEIEYIEPFKYWGRRALRITARNPGGRPIRFELLLRHPDDFLAALKAGSAGVASGSTP